MRDFFRRFTGPIRIERVPIGQTVASLPIATLSGKTIGPSAVITAGLDGDEYASIEAAYRLIDRFTDGDFAGKLAIIPLVNAAGFADEVSFNPVDHRYPKTSIPGKTDGTPTERLMHHVVSRYVTGSALWIDLHGGALTEALSPFVWLHKTSTPADTETERLIRLLDAPAVLYDPTPLHFSRALARTGTRFMLTESGEYGSRDPKHVAYHLRWVETALTHLGMLRGEAPITHPKTYTAITYVGSPASGIWRPEPFRGDAVGKGQLLGELRSFDMKRRVAVKSPTQGAILWRKTGMSATSDQTLLAIAR